MRSWQKVCAQPVPANSGGEDILRKDSASTLSACCAASPSSSSTSSRSSSSGCCARSSGWTAPTTASRCSTSACAACAPGEPVTTTGGVQVVPEHGLDALQGADLVAVPATGLREFPEEALQALRDASAAGRHPAHRLLRGVRARGGRAAGRPPVHRALEERRRAARTPPGGDHRPGRAVRRRRQPRHQRRHRGRHRRRAAPGAPRARQRRRQRHRPPHGRAAAARRRPAPVRRAADPAVLGGRARPDPGLGAGEPDVEHSVADLARRARMSDRSFARRFVAETGTTPHRWLTLQRVLLAQRLLEDTDLAVDDVARALRLRHGRAAAPPLPQGRRRRPGRLPPHLPRDPLPASPPPRRPERRVSTSPVAEGRIGIDPTARRRHDERASPGGGGGRRPVRAVRGGGAGRLGTAVTSTSWTACPPRTAWSATASRPDHMKMKSVIRVLARPFGPGEVRFLGGVQVGDGPGQCRSTVLREHYTAVVHATGCVVDRRSGIPGEDLPGSSAPAAIVGWYCGAPRPRHLAPAGHRRRRRRRGRATSRWTSPACWPAPRTSWSAPTSPTPCSTRCGAAPSATCTC